MCCTSGLNRTGGAAKFEAVFLRSVIFSAEFLTSYVFLTPVPVAARSKVCGRLPAEIVGLNPTRGMVVVSVVCCQVEVSATSWSFVQRSPTRLWCVVVCDLETSRMRRP
jgi:hypothetical protein